MKVLTICPTKGRPELCRKMIESWHNTIMTDNTIVLGCDIGDEKLTMYKEIKKANKIFCKAGSTVTETINSIFLQNPTYDFYHITNDDMTYQTKGWDKKFVTLYEEYGNGIFYGNDTFQGENLPTFPFVSGDLVRALGWLQLPSLNRYAGDVVWKFIGENCRCLYYLDGVILKHDWTGCSDAVMNISDMKKFAEWLTQSHLDLNKVRNVL